MPGHQALLLACGVIASLSIPLRAGAQEVLSLSQALDEAQRQNPDLQTERLRLKVARSQQTLARLLLPANPELEFEQRADRWFGNQGEGGHSLSLAQEVEIAGQRGKRKRVADLAFQQAQAEIAQAEQGLSAQVKAAYYRLALSQEKMKVVDDLLELNEHLTAATAQRYRAGDISELEFNLVAAEYGQVLAERAAQEAEARSAAVELNLFLGRPADRAVSVEVDSSYHPLDLDLGQLQILSVERRQDLRALRLEEQAATTGINLARAEAIPNPKIALSYERERAVFAAEDVLGNPGSIAGLRDTDRLLRVQVALPLPLVNRNQAGVQQARAEHQVATSRREGLERRISGEVTTVHHLFIGAQQALEAYQSALPRTKQNVELLLRAYEGGELDLTALLVQTDRLFRLRLAYFDALLAYHQALARLEQAVGGPLPDILPRR